VVAALQIDANLCKPIQIDATQLVGGVYLTQCPLAINLGVWIQKVCGGSFANRCKPTQIDATQVGGGVYVSQCHIAINLGVWIYGRDLARVEEATTLERLSMSDLMRSPQTVQLTLTMHKLQAPSEVTTLCHYLRDAIRFRYHAYHLHPKQDIGVLSINNWHVSFINRKMDGCIPVKLGEDDEDSLLYEPGDNLQELVL